MFRNYFKTAVRSISNNRFYAAVNVLGLAVGIASFVIILVYLNYELSYDKWDPSLKSVKKITLQRDNDILHGTPAPLAAFLLQNYPNAEAATSIMPAGDYPILLDAGNKKIYQTGVVTVDSSFFTVFPYTLVQGDPANVLNAPNAVILSEEVSRKLFGNADPMGKPIKIYNSFDGVITGIMKKAGGPSHLDAQMLMRDPYQKQNMHWGNYSYQTYIKTKQPVAAAQFENDINRIYYNNRIKKDNQSFESYKKAGQKTLLFSDAVQDLHNFPSHGTSHFRITIILLILAVFLLIAGAINFSNLSLAKAITRAKEVGIRKVLGSSRAHIIFQSLLEIAIQCILSLLLAILFVNIALPWFSKNFNLPLNFFESNNLLSICLQIGSTLALLIVVSGLYPALFLSKYATTEVLKGNYNKGSKGVFFRNSLLVVQLTLSALFITGMIVINRQMDFMQTRDLGFNGSKVIRIEAMQNSREGNFDHIRNILLAVPGVESVSKSTTVPGSQNIDTATDNFKFAGNTIRLNSVKVGIDYFKTMDIPLLEGRLFGYNHTEDMNNSAIVNETALHRMGVANPVGQLVYFPDCDSVPFTIVGVVKDFHVQGLQSHVEPAIYTTSNGHCGFYQSGGAILVKMNTRKTNQTLASITAAWKNIEPAFPIRYSFLDQDFQHLLTEYIRLGQVVLFFTIISILIAATGLFALTSFLAKQRVKEIGIRKVLGASVGSITALLSKDFVKLVMVAILIATPLAYWALSKWLEDFAYRINLSWWMFGAAGLAVLLIALITVSMQAVKAAVANPVESLRSE